MTKIPKKIEWLGSGYGYPDTGYIQSRKPMDEIELLIRTVNELIDLAYKQQSEIQDLKDILNIGTGGGKND